MNVESRGIVDARPYQLLCAICSIGEGVDHPENEKVDLLLQTVKADPDAPKLYAALDTAPVGFARLKELTLVTGHLNRLWHRQSVDRMYEWLIRDVKRCRAGDSTRPRIEKVVLRGYAHQDLLWAPTAERDVFPTLAKGLGLAEPAR